MDDRNRHLVHRLGDAAPWVVGVLAVGALLVPFAGAGRGGHDERSLASGAPSARRLTFPDAQREPVVPPLQSASSVPVDTVPETPVSATPTSTAPAVVGSATTRPPKDKPLPPGFPWPGKSSVFVDQPARRRGAPTVVVLGDSLTVGASPGLQAFLADVNLRLDARVGRPTIEGVQAAASTKASRADIVVVALGTNDSCSPAECRQRVNSVLAALGPTAQVIWMPPVMFRPNIQAMRTAIAAAAQTTAGRMTVLEWQPYLDDHPKIISTDGIHLTSEGYRLRAQVTADEIHRLAAAR